MNSKRLLYLVLVVSTLSIGVMIGTVVSGGVKAGEQKPELLQIPPLPEPQALSNVFSQISDRVGPAVVTIRTEVVVPVSAGRGGRGGRGAAPAIPDLGDLFGLGPSTPENTEKSLGTGFIVDKSGYILTNHHVIEAPEGGSVKKITVVLSDKSEHTAKLVGGDEETDLAVVKVDAGRELPVAKFGNSDAARTGDWVLAIGSPFQFDHTVTAGIISAKGRDSSSNNMGTQFQSFIQTDAAINPGNSGGPLLNMQGEVIGINTAIVSQSRSFAGLGFALPSNSAVTVYNQLVQSGKVTRGYLGISYATEQEKLLRAYGFNADSGVVVSEVVAGQAAAKAGLKAYDIITQIGAKKITSTNVLLEVIANSPVGSTVQVRVMRDGKEVTLPVVVGDREEYNKLASVPVPPAPPPATGGNNNNNNNNGGRGGRGGRGANPATPAPNARGAQPVPAPVQARSLGLSVQALDEALIQRYLLAPDVVGVLVTSVQPGSVSEDAGVTPGWVVTRLVVGGQTTIIRTPDDYARVERGLRSGAEVAVGFLARLGARGAVEYRSAIVTMTMP
jgi:serine protease Do